MKIGMCGSILSDLYEKAAAAGFDYFECSFSDMAVRPEADVLAAEEKIAKIGLPVLGANGLLKGGIAVVGAEVVERHRQHQRPRHQRQDAPQIIAALAVFVVLIVVGHAYPP